MPRKNKKRCTKAINVTQKDKLMKLFDEVSSGESVAGEHYSDKELEESERSDDEKEGSKHSENSSDSSNHHDPFSDADGEYGSDANYEPGEDEAMLTETSSNSDTSESSQVSQSDSNSRKYVTKPMQSPDKQTSSTMIDCSAVIEVQVTSSKQTANQEHLNLLATAIPSDCSPVIQTSILSQEQMEEQLNQTDVNTQKECSPPIQISSIHKPPIQVQSNQQAADTPIDCSLVLELEDISQETTSPEQPSRPAVSTPMDCSDVIQASSPSENPTQEQQSNQHVVVDIEIHYSPDSQVCSSQQREASSVQSVNQLECSQVAQSNSSQERQQTPPANLENELNVGRLISSPTNVSSWEDTTLPIIDFQFDHTSSGPTVPLNNNITPINILEYFFTDEMVDLVVSCTNAYGTALCNSNRPHTRGSRAQSFKLTDAEEMKKFLGLCILQGHLDVPSIRKLFTLSDPLYCYPIFPYVMSGRRFEQILRCLCISELNSKGIQKVKVFTDKVIRNFQTLNQPGKHLSLDESLMPFRGRLSFRQYMKGKKAKYGIKFYALTTSDGYILNFIIYEGKNTVTEGNATEPILEKLVMKLMQPYLNKGHDLYMDNFYNSVSLSKKLLAYNTHTTGTLRKDRKQNPKELFKKKLKSGEHAWKRNAKVYASIWKDKRPVFMITTKHHPRLVTTRNRYGKVKSKPVEIEDYNKHMSGIDRSDQMMAYYSTPKKTIRWYKKVFFRLLDMVIWNAFYLFKKHCDPKASLLDFRENIVNSYIQANETTMEDIIKKMLVKKHASRRHRRVNEGQALQMAPEIGHWPEPIPLRENSKRNKVFLKCRVCTKNKIVKQTSYRCKGCVGNPPLCPGCFELWHTDPIFRN